MNKNIFIMIIVLLILSSFTYALDLGIDYEDVNLYNASIFVYTNETCELLLWINNVTYYDSDFDFSLIDIYPLDDDTIYPIIYNCSNENSSIAGIDYFRTLSYNDLDLTINEERNNYILYGIILFVLFLLYILSEVYQHILLGYISGIGFLIFSFVFLTIELWFFLILLFFGLFILIRFTIGILRGG